MGFLVDHETLGPFWHVSLFLHASRGLVWAAGCLGNNTCDRGYDPRTSDFTTRPLALAQLRDPKG